MQSIFNFTLLATLNEAFPEADMDMGAYYNLHRKHNIIVKYFTNQIGLLGLLLRIHAPNNLLNANSKTKKNTVKIKRENHFHSTKQKKELNFI